MPEASRVGALVSAVKRRQMGWKQEAKHPVQNHTGRGTPTEQLSPRRFEALKETAPSTF